MASRCNTLFKQLIQEAVDRVKECRVQTRGRFDNHVEEKPPVPIALWPSVFPRKHYEFLLRVQKDYNLLVNKLSGSKLIVDTLQRLV